MFEIDVPEFVALQEALDGVADIEAAEMTDGQVHRQLKALLCQRAKLALRGERWFAASDSASRDGSPCDAAAEE